MKLCNKYFKLIGNDKKMNYDLYRIIHYNMNQTIINCLNAQANMEEEIPITNASHPYYMETKIKLKQLLDSSRSAKIHTENILQLPTLKYAHMYCKYNNLSGQFTGPVLEKYIKIKYQMKKNNASDCKGDLHSNNVDIEIKASNGGKENNRFNYVQLRMNHVCEYLLTAYYIDYENIDNLGELYIFRLDKENIKYFILKYGGYAHGTIGELGKITESDLNDVENNKEYAFRPKYGTKCWNELLQFRIDEGML